jgi:hypothetical protein
LPYAVESEGDAEKSPKQETPLSVRSSNPAVDQPVSRDNGLTVASYPDSILSPFECHLSQGGRDLGEICFEESRAAAGSGLECIAMRSLPVEL